MSTLEDRLSAALAARAELVQPEDLNHRAPPPTAVPWRRRPATYVLAAAACGAAVAVPFLVGVGGDGEDRPAPPVVTPTAPLTPDGDEVPGADWTEAYSYPRAYDVDGDGAPDEVVVRTQGAEALPPGTRRVEVHLSSGGVAAVLLDYDTYDLTMVEPVELDGEPGDELLYYRGTETEEIGVLRYADGALVDLEVPADPGITSQVDDRGRIRAWWTRDTALLSSRSVEGGFVPGDGGKPVPARYPVELWTWTVDGEGLVASPSAERCVESLQPTRPFPCTDPE